MVLGLLPLGFYLLLFTLCPSPLNCLGYEGLLGAGSMVWGQSEDLGFVVRSVVVRSFDELEGP